MKNSDDFFSWPDWVAVDQTVSQRPDDKVLCLCRLIRRIVLLSDPRVGGDRGGEPGSSLVLGQLPADPCHSAPLPPPSLARSSFIQADTEKFAQFPSLLRAVINHHNFPCICIFSAFFFSRPLSAVSAQFKVNLPGRDVMSAHVASRETYCCAPSSQCQRATLFWVFSRRKIAPVIRLKNHWATSNFFMPVDERRFNTWAPRSMRRSGRASTRWAGLFQHNVVIDPYLRGPRWHAWALRAAVRTQVSPSDREVVQAADGIEKIKETKKCGHLWRNNSTILLYRWNKGLCVCVCVCGSGGVTRTDVFSINYCVTLPPALLPLHLQRHH